MSRLEEFGISGKVRRIPVEAAGMRTPLEPRHDPGAMIEPEEGTRQPPGFKRVVGAVTNGLVKPTTVDPRALGVRATQDRLTRGSLEKHLSTPGARGRGNGGGPTTHPVIYKDDDGQHYVIDGHHRTASAMLQGKQLDAVVVHAGHIPLHNEVQDATEHVRLEYAAKSEALHAEAHAKGKRIYGRADDPTVDLALREKHTKLYKHYYPQNARPKERVAMGLPREGSMYRR